MVVAFFAPFYQIGAMVVLSSPERIELESCACAQFEALQEGNGWFYPDDAGDLSEQGRNMANLMIDGGGIFCPFFSSYWCHSSAYISLKNRARKLRLHSNWSSCRGEWLVLPR